MGRFLTPLLPPLGVGLLAFIFFIKIDIHWEKINLFWLMAFVFHIPLLLFLVAAVMVEITALVGKRDAGRVIQTLPNFLLTCVIKVILSKKDGVS